MKTIKVKYWSDKPDNFTGIVIDQYGDKYYYQNGKYHRLDGPAVEYASGYKAYYQNDQCHRLDGPAIEWADGSKAWWILDQELTEKQFNLFQKLWDQTIVDKTEKAMLAYTKLVSMKE